MNINLIRKIILLDWDPLGVGDNPNLADEYDDYLPDIYTLLMSHCKVSQLEDHLRRIEEGSLGIQTPEAPRRIAAEKLIRECSTVNAPESLD